MCGIIGYIGDKEAAPILLDGLHRLEYRGYDSAGIAIIEGDRILLKKCSGRICNLEESLKDEIVKGHIGLGHTRWATHGRPTVYNAHPHTDCTEKLLVVHNGIIDNYLPLKEQLQKTGHTFRTETDTEVIAHLIEEHYRGDLELAVHKALEEIEGSYALGVMSALEADRIVAARKGSPLVVGLGDGEQFIASDVPALLSRTRRIIFLDDGEIAVLTRDGVKVTREGILVSKAITDIQWDVMMTEKGGYKHFMLKEINEQPDVFRSAMSNRLFPGEGKVILENLKLNEEEIRRLQRISIIACGTAYHAGLVGKYILEKLIRLPVEVDLGSEFRYRDPIILDNNLTVAISQSGETADTLAAVREAKAKGSKVVAIVNVMGSSLTREAEGGLVYIHAGPEIGVASTKAYSGMLICLYLLALYLEEIRGIVDKERHRAIIEELLRLPQKAQLTLQMTKEIKECARLYSDCQDFLYLGRGINYPTALEGALKLKEISYIHAEGYAAGEMKHGPIALLDKNTPIVAVALPGRTYGKLLGNLEEAKARDSTRIVVASEEDKEIKKYADHIIPIPYTLEILSPALAVIPLQLLAYYIADRLGCDVDKPRNLAKSVTVE